MRRICILAGLLLGAALLTSCAGFNPVTEDLMRPPRLNAEQKAIEDALLASVGAEEISFKYPQYGNYRSAFVFQDIDGDAQEEALVFYANGTNAYARLAVLDQDENGNWSGICELSGPHLNVEFLSFNRLTGRTAPDVIVGWSDPDTLEKRIGIYTYQEGNLLPRIDGTPLYDSYLIADLDRNKVEDLVLFTRNSGTKEESSWVHLFTFDGYQIEMSSELPLSDSIMGFAGAVSGRMRADDKRIGLFVDELRVSNTLVTEVFTVQGGQLQPIISHAMVSAADSNLQPEEAGLQPSTAADTIAAVDAAAIEGEEAPVEQPTLYELTMRSDMTAICADINNDGIVEIPTGRLLPAYEDADTADQLYLTEYNQLAQNGFQRVFAAVNNRAAGYQVRFPDAWMEQVTVVNQMENNEWRFIQYNDELRNPLEDVSGELLRIRVVSQKDYQDKFLENYTVLAVRGAFTFYGYIPEGDPSPLRITMDQLRSQLFSLL